MRLPRSGLLLAALFNFFTVDARLRTLYHAVHKSWP